MEKIISLKSVWKTYQMGEVEVTALRDVSLDVNKGDFLAIAGPSGSGKSTMMNLVGCLDQPSRGNVFLDGTDIAKLTESGLAQARGKKIGFIFQQFNLMPTLTALENVRLPLEFQDNDPREATEKARKMLEMVGLGDRIGHLPNQLSGGQRQRVAIARALVADPEIILADEPTGNLDSRTGKFIMDFLGRVHKEEERTIIIVTHDPNLVQYADKVARIKDGEIVEIKYNS